MKEYIIELDKMKSILDNITKEMAEKGSSKFIMNDKRIKYINKIFKGIDDLKNLLESYSSKK